MTEPAWKTSAMRGWGYSIAWNAQNIRPTEEVRRAVDAGTLAFWDDPEWAAWLAAAAPADGTKPAWFYIEVKECAKTRYRMGSRDGIPDVSCYTPAEPFRPHDPATSARLMQELQAGLYRYLASKRNLPPPPNHLPK